MNPRQRVPLSHLPSLLLLLAASTAFAHHNNHWEIEGWGPCVSGGGAPHRAYDLDTPEYTCGMFAQQVRGTICAVEGTQTAELECYGGHGGEAGPLPDAECAGVEKPATTRACSATVEDSLCDMLPPLEPPANTCKGLWWHFEVGEWEYEDTCGAVVRTRDYWCVNPGGQVKPDERCTHHGIEIPVHYEIVERLDGCSYEWSIGEWSAPDNSCSAEALQTRSVTCLRSDGMTVADAECGLESKPESSRTVEDFSGCTYSWNTGDFGACAGGGGEWAAGAWSPLSGCGVISQSRDVTCVIEADSGIRSRTVTCLRSDGTEVDGSFCDPAEEPQAQVACTPTDPAICGKKPAGSRTALLDDACLGPNVAEECQRAGQRYCIAMPLRT